MASVTGSRLAFFSSTVTADKVNVVLTADGTNAIDNDGKVLGTVGSQTIAGGFNIEVFTTAAGSLAAGFQASAFIQGGIKLTNNVVQAGTPSSTEQLTQGTYTLTDLSGGSSPNESIQIVGTGTDSFVVVGSAGDTITGSSVATVQQFIDASGTNKNANPGPFAGPETVTGGAGGTTVLGGKGDVITGGAGALQVNDASGGDSIKGGAGSLTAFSLGAGDTISGSTGGTTFIDDTYGSGGGSKIVGGSGTGTIFGIGNTIIFAEKNDAITVGSATSLISTRAGDTVTGGSGTVTGAGGTAFNTLIGVTGKGVINLGGAATYVDTQFWPSVLGAAATGSTVTGGAGLATIYGGAGVAIVGGAGAVQVNDYGGKNTITGGAGNLQVDFLGSGATITGSTAGTTKVTDNSVTGGKNNITGGSGATTIIGAAGDTITGGSGATSVTALAGSETITAGSGATTVQSGKGDSIIGGSGTLQVFLNDDQGNATVGLSSVAGRGAASLRDVSVKGASTAVDSVTGFATATDVIQSKSSVDATNKFLGTSSSDATGTTLTFLDGQKMFLAGVTDVTKVKFSQ